MAFQSRKAHLVAIEAQRESSVVLYATSDRQNMASQISNDIFDFLAHHLDEIWKRPGNRITLILHTAGGDTAAAWRIINLLRMFCDDLEVIVPVRAHSAGTLMCLGANRIVMTKQATLGPIDPSLSGPLSPAVPGQPMQRVPVSVEAAQGYIDIAKVELGLVENSSLSSILINLSSHVHPLVLGQIFRTRNQIRALAQSLLENQSVEEDSRKRIVAFLCSESGSHDRTINRREARELGLNAEKPSEELYGIISDLYEDIAAEMQLRDAFDPMTELSGKPQASFSCVRVLLESIEGGSIKRVTEGQVQLLQAQGPQGIPVSAAETKITFDSWRKET